MHSLETIIAINNPKATKESVALTQHQLDNAERAIASALRHAAMVDKQAVATILRSLQDVRLSLAESALE